MAVEQHLFSAVTSSARQLHTLLRCISFASKVQVHISEDGLRFSASDSSVMEGHAFLDKKLFTTFKYRSSPQDEDESASAHVFEINFPALLETLQVLGAIFGPEGQSSSSRFQAFNKPVGAFAASTLGLSSLCTITYPDIGDPLTLILKEGNIETTCELTTYEPAQVEDIPFSRDQLATKVIMKSEWLADAISELAATNPERLTIEAGPARVGFRLSASGPLGSAEVEFDRSRANAPDATTTFSHPTQTIEVPTASTSGLGVLETFLVQKRSVNSYRFSMIRAASLAMKQAIKVSIRVDDQGVLSLQFMIEVETASGSLEGDISFVDFRFVPLVAEDGDEGMDGGDEDTSSTDED